MNALKTAGSRADSSRVGSFPNLSADVRETGRHLARAMVPAVSRRGLLSPYRLNAPISIARPVPAELKASQIAPIGSVLPPEPTP